MNVVQLLSRHFIERQKGVYDLSQHGVIIHDAALKSLIEQTKLNLKTREGNEEVCQKKKKNAKIFTTFL